MARRFTVEAVFSAVDRVSAPLNRMQQRVGRFARSARARLDRLNHATNRIGSAMWSGFRVGAIAAAAAITTVFLALRGFANEADALAKRSRRFQIDIEALQEYNFVAQQAGLSSEEFDKALEGLAKRMGEARAGMGSLYMFLQKSDRATLRQLQRTDDLAEAFDLVVAAIQKQPDAMRQAALANAAFGRQGMKMANVAEIGAEGVRALREEMRQNGLITKESAENAEAYNDAMNSLKLAARGLLYQGLSPLLPILSRLARQAREWVVANREEVVNRISDGISWLVLNYDRLWDRLVMITKITGYFIALGLAIKTVNGLLLAMNLLASASPFGRLVIGLIAISAALATQIDDWDAFAAAAKKSIADIDSRLSNFARGLESTGRLLGRTLFTIVEAIKEAVEPAIDLFVSIFTGAWDRIDDHARAVMDSWAGRLLELIPGVSSMRAADQLAQGLRGDRDGDDDQDDDQAQQSNGPQALVTPAARTASEFRETNTREVNELLIRDETGRAVPNGPSWARGGGLSLIRTGAINR